MTITTEIRQKFNEFISRGVKVTNSFFEAYTEKGLSDEKKKERIEDQKALKIAISNIEDLLNLAEKINVPDAKDKEDELALLLERANEELEKYDERTGNE